MPASSSILPVTLLRLVGINGLIVMFFKFNVMVQNDNKEVPDLLRDFKLIVNHCSILWPINEIDYKWNSIIVIAIEVE